MQYLLITMLALLSMPALAKPIEADKSAARILVYYGIGNDSSPATNVTIEQFNTHIAQLVRGEYNVIALPDMIEAYRQNQPLPKNSVVLTFDGSHKSILNHAAPLLKKHQFPFTVFIAPTRIRDKSPRFLNYKDIKRLRKIQLVSFGIHPEGFDKMVHHDMSSIRSSLNNSVAFYRDLFGTHPKFLAFSQGAYSDLQIDALNNYDFDVVLGQHSGVAHQNNEGDILPRFVMTENYADQNRFNLVTRALPLPVNDAHPKPTVLKYNSPAIGFTSASNINLNKLSCFASGQEKPRVERLNNRIEIRLKQKISTSHFRVNCTLPETNKARNETRWRWHGFLFERP